MFSISGGNQMASSSVQTASGSVIPIAENPAQRSFTHEIVGGRVVSWLTGRVLLIQPPPDKPKSDHHTDELEATIDSVLEDEKRLREAKKLGSFGIAGTDAVPDDLSSLQGTELRVRELVPTP